MRRREEGGGERGEGGEGGSRGEEGDRGEGEKGEEKKTQPLLVRNCPCTSVM